MADIVDLSQEEYNTFLKASLQTIRNAKRIQHRGYCLWCEEPLEHDERWCSPECRDDWQKYEDKD